MEAPPKLPSAPKPLPPPPPRRLSRLDVIFLTLGITCTVVFAGFAFFAPPSPANPNSVTGAFERVRIASQDKAVLNNARQLAAAADQYYLETGSLHASWRNIVGPTNYVKTIQVVAGETYPTHFTQGITMTITGIAGARTITYAP